MIFYIIISILAIISPVNAYNREKILKKIGIENEIVIVSIGIQVIFLTWLLIRRREIIPKNMSRSTCKYLIINIILASIVLYLGGYMIKWFDVLRYKSLQKPIYLFFLVIIACIIYKKRCNYQVVLGIGLLICGCVLVDRNLK